jgi:hypothetical protein
LALRSRRPTFTTRHRRANVQVIVIFDGDTEGDERTRKIKERLLADLNLPGDHTLTLDQSEPGHSPAVPTTVYNRWQGFSGEDRASRNAKTPGNPGFLAS